MLIQHALASKNLLSANPKVQRTWMLPLPSFEQLNPLMFCGFINAGRTAILAYQGGLVQLWDITPELPMPKVIRASDEDLDHGASQAGKLLGEYNTTRRCLSIDFQVSQSKDDTIDVFFVADQLCVCLERDLAPLIDCS